MNFSVQFKNSFHTAVLYDFAQTDKNVIIREEKNNAVDKHKINNQM